MLSILLLCFLSLGFAEELQVYGGQVNPNIRRPEMTRTCFYMLAPKAKIYTTQNFPNANPVFTYTICSDGKGKPPHLGGKGSWGFTVPNAGSLGSYTGNNAAGAQFGRADVQGFLAGGQGTREIPRTPQCTDPEGNRVPYLYNAGFPKTGWATWLQQIGYQLERVVLGQPYIFININHFLQYPMDQDFINYLYAHECCHHKLGQVLGAVITVVNIGWEGELAADCCAMSELLEDGLTKAQYDNTLKQLAKLPGDSANLPGWQRAKIIRDGCARFPEINLPPACNIAKKRGEAMPAICLPPELPPQPQQPINFFGGDDDLPPGQPIPVPINFTDVPPTFTDPIITPPTSIMDLIWDVLIDASRPTGDKPGFGWIPDGTRPCYINTTTNVVIVEPSTTAVATTGVVSISTSGTSGTTSFSSTGAVSVSTSGTSSGTTSFSSTGTSGSAGTTGIRVSTVADVAGFREDGDDGTPLEARPWIWVLVALAILIALLMGTLLGLLYRTRKQPKEDNAYEMMAN